MLAVSASGSVVNEVMQGGANRICYTPYGHLDVEQAIHTSLGYNGEFKERQTGYYLLGNGYRAYNPVTMKFNSPDSLSPFGEGGVNPYAYCEGDSINNVDPTGRFFQRLFGFRLTTNSHRASRIPQRLKTNPKASAPATLHKIKKEDVFLLQKTAGHKANLADVAGEKYHAAKSKSEAAAKTAYQHAELEAFEANEAYRYAKNHVGKKGITKYAREDAKATADGYNTQVLEKLVLDDQRSYDEKRSTKIRQNSGR